MSPPTLYFCRGHAITASSTEVEERHRRRTEILDGALAVLADQGMRGLTHRAVDTAAGLPAGSTSYYFRSRAALVAGCVRRLLERDLEHDVPEAVAGAPAPGEPCRGLADALTGDRGAHGDRRAPSDARPLRAQPRRRPRPGLRAELVRGGDVIRQRGAALLHRAGATDPAAAAAEVAAVLDGLVYTALTRGPDDPGHLAAWLRPPLRPAGAEPAGPRDRGRLIVGRARARNSRAEPRQTRVHVTAGLACAAAGLACPAADCAVHGRRTRVLGRGTRVHGRRTRRAAQRRGRSRRRPASRPRCGTPRIGSGPAPTSASTSFAASTPDAAARSMSPVRNGVST